MLFSIYHSPTGIFVGAVVQRGADWDWENQDGGSSDGNTATGTVTSIRGWEQESAVGCLLFFSFCVSSFLYFVWHIVNRIIIMEL